LTPLFLTYLKVFWVFATLMLGKNNCKRIACQQRFLRFALGRFPARKTGWRRQRGDLKGHKYFYLQKLFTMENQRVELPARKIV